jgi:hypothetical protein
MLKNMLELLKDGHLGVEADLMLSELMNELVSSVMAFLKMATFALHEFTVLLAVMDRESFATMSDHFSAMNDVVHRMCHV